MNVTFENGMMKSTKYCLRKEGERRGVQGTGIQERG
jgi:hypothetical protein